MRTNGNLALNPAYRPQYQPTQANLKKKAVLKAHETGKKKAKSINVAVALFYIAVIFAVAFCLIGREVSIYEKSAEISRLQNKLEQAQSETKQARIAAEKSVDLKTIEDNATNKFAMSRPEKTQTVYINIKQQDYAEKTADKDAGVELQQNIQAGIKNLFGIFGNK